MTSVKGLDLAWDRPSVADIKATGAHWVARYFSRDDSKDLHKDEVTAYHAADLGLVTIWETSAGRATVGYSGGVTDAQSADAQRAAVGLPPNHVLYFAVDEDTSWASVLPYFQGVIRQIGIGRVGAYGGVRIMEGAHASGIHYLWQTQAWSNGVWSVHANITQEGTALGGKADIDYAHTTDFGQYPRPASPVVLPTVHLSHLLAAAARDPRAPQGHTTFASEVKIVEHALNAEGLLASKWVDGSFGSMTVSAYAGWQHKLGYSGKDANGYPGIKSLTSLAHRHAFLAAP
jgi:hypothetical protein